MRKYADAVEKMPSWRTHLEFFYSSVAQYSLFGNVFKNWRTEHLLVL